MQIIVYEGGANEVGQLTRSGPNPPNRLGHACIEVQARLLISGRQQAQSGLDQLVPSGLRVAIQ